MGEKGAENGALNAKGGAKNDSEIVNGHTIQLFQVGDAPKMDKKKG